MKTKPYKRACFALGLMLFAQAARLCAAIDIQFDYTYDTNSFFVGHPDRQSVLNAAALTYESRLADTLLSITPTQTNTWSAIFNNPSDGTQLNISNLAIGQNVILVFVGAQQLGSTLGMGGPGGFSANGTQTFINAVKARGQSGALSQTPTDFGPWGGAMTFDIDANWYFGSGNLPGNNDFYSVAVHELGHLFGIGTAAAWTNQISGTQFNGPKATQANGGTPPPLSADLAHWANGTMSTIFNTSTAQETAMDPSLTVGTRKEFTTLDYAALGDIGWQVVPEPSVSALLALAGIVVVIARGRARQFSAVPVWLRSCSRVSDPGSAANLSDQGH
jgi:Matrixin